MNLIAWLNLINWIMSYHLYLDTHIVSNLLDWTDFADVMIVYPHPHEFVSQKMAFSREIVSGNHTIDIHPSQLVSQKNLSNHDNYWSIIDNICMFDLPWTMTWVVYDNFNPDGVTISCWGSNLFVTDIGSCTQIWI